MNALADQPLDQPLIAPGDFYDFHQEWIARHAKPGFPSDPPCPGVLRYTSRYAQGKWWQVDCDNPYCHFGIAVAAANAEAVQSKKARRLDRLMDDAQPEVPGPESPGGEDSP